MSMRTPKPIIDFLSNVMEDDMALLANLRVAEAEDDFDTLIQMLEDVKDVAQISIETLKEIQKK